MPTEYYLLTYVVHPGYDSDLFSGATEGECFIKLCRKLGHIPNLIHALPLTLDQVVELQKLSLAT